MEIFCTSVETGLTYIQSKGEITYKYLAQVQLKMRLAYRSFYFLLSLFDPFSEQPISNRNLKRIRSRCYSLQDFMVFLETIKFFHFVD